MAVCLDVLYARGSGSGVRNVAGCRSSSSRSTGCACTVENKSRLYATIRNSARFRNRRLYSALALFPRTTIHPELIPHTQGGLGEVSRDNFFFRVPHVFVECMGEGVSATQAEHSSVKRPPAATAPVETYSLALALFTNYTTLHPPPPPPPTPLLRPLVLSRFGISRSRAAHVCTCTKRLSSVESLVPERGITRSLW